MGSRTSTQGAEKFYEVRKNGRSGDDSSGTHQISNGNVSSRALPMHYFPNLKKNKRCFWWSPFVVFCMRSCTHVVVSPGPIQRDPYK